MPIYRKYCSRTRSYKIYRGVRGRTARASGRRRSAAGRHTQYGSRVCAFVQQHHPTVYEIVQHEGVHAGTSSYHMNCSMPRPTEMTYIASYSVGFRQQRNVDLREHITYTTLVVSSPDLRYLEGRFFPRAFNANSRVVLHFPNVSRVGRLLSDN